MSFIHDALRRSQQERERGQSVGPGASGGATPPGGREPQGSAPRLLYGLPVMLALFAGIWWWVVGSEPQPAVPASNVAGPSSPLANTAMAMRNPIPANSKAVPSVPSTRRTYGDLPFAWELQAPLRQRVAALAMTIHVYAQSPANRVLFLNDREYRQGDRMPDGVEVVEIVPEGAVLSLGETYFRLPRPR